MLIPAIDTALEACAAAVLDTQASKLIARESQAMKRGHAEALMPLIARLRGLPVIHRDAAARHSEFAEAFRARRGRSPADISHPPQAKSDFAIQLIMPDLVPGIDVFAKRKWPGRSPAMTKQSIHLRKQHHSGVQLRRLADAGGLRRRALHA